MPPITKYIVNNTSQDIDGNISVSGDISANSITDNQVGYYKALLTQTGSIVGDNITIFGQNLIIGEIYTITTYILGDDFSNIADVISGDINTTGCVFRATGEVPSVWVNSSVLTSSGGLIVDLIENTLGFDLDWVWGIFFPPGVYAAYNVSFGPVGFSFDRNKTYISSQRSANFVSNPAVIVNNLCQVANVFDYNDFIILGAFDYDYLGTSDNTLCYTPVEITIKRDLTPIEISCISVQAFNFSNVAIELLNNGSHYGYYYTNNGSVVTNNSEIIYILNNSINTNFMGTFSLDNGGNIILLMPTYIKNQIFGETGELTFEIFAD